MAGQLLDMYIKITAANFQQYVQDDVVNCNSVYGRHAVTAGAATYCDSAGDAVVPAWGPSVVSAAVEDAAPTLIVISYDMAMAITDKTGYSVTVDGVAATVNSAAAATNKITLTMASAIANAEVVLVTYDASAGNAENTNATADAVAVDTVNYLVTNNVAA